MFNLLFNLSDAERNFSRPQRKQHYPLVYLGFSNPISSLCILKSQDDQRVLLVSSRYILYQVLALRSPLLFFQVLLLDHDRV